MGTTTLFLGRCRKIDVYIKGKIIKYFANLYSSPYISRAIKKKDDKIGETRSKLRRYEKLTQNFGRRREKKRSLGILTHTWENNAKIDL
jgi:hypothetical protein